MTEEGLTVERILETAEDVLRRYGPAKAAVVDVARALGVSHGSVYRYFPSKAALRDAVLAHWLARMSAPLVGSVGMIRPALERLRRWFELLMRSERARAFSDPELFATYIEVVSEARTVVKAHNNELVEQIRQIIAEGAARGEFRVADSAASAHAVFSATTRFHHPAHAVD